MSPQARLSLSERRKLNKGASLKIECSSPIHAGLEDSYDLQEVLGQGALGLVRRAVHRTTGQEVALKIFQLPHQEVAAVARAEHAMLQRVDHPNIVKAMDFFTTSTMHPVLSLSYFDGMELGLAVRSQRERCLTEAIAHRPFKILLDALDHLHQRGIVHCDVKPQNILASRDFRDLMLIDFNIAICPLEQPDLVPKCSGAYAAPEVRKGNTPTAAGDVWGAGLCLVMMLSGHCDVSLDSLSVSEPCAETLRHSLAKDASLRSSVSTLLNMGWLASDATEESSECSTGKQHWQVPTTKALSEVNRKHSRSNASLSTASMGSSASSTSETSSSTSA